MFLYPVSFSFGAIIDWSLSIIIQVWIGIPIIVLSIEELSESFEFAINSNYMISNENGYKTDGHSHFQLTNFNVWNCLTHHYDRLCDMMQKRCFSFIATKKNFCFSCRRRRRPSNTFTKFFFCIRFHFQCFFFLAFRTMVTKFEVVISRWVWVTAQ